MTEPRRVTVAADENLWQTREEVGAMHARVHFGHDNFHEVSREIVATSTIRGGGGYVHAVVPHYEITYEEDA